MTGGNGRRQLGSWGETQAAAYLGRQGYRIVGRNVRCGRGELDLVAWDGPVLVFVEVRTKYPGRFGTAEESMTGSKRRHVVEAARCYLAREQPAAPAYRFDFVAVLPKTPASGEPEVDRILLIKDAFSAGKS